MVRSINMISDEKNYEKPTLKLIGENGNIFNLLGLARRRFRELKQETGDETWQHQWEELYDEVTSSDSYEDALITISKYFKII